MNVTEEYAMYKARIEKFKIEMGHLESQHKSSVKGIALFLVIIFLTVCNAMALLIASYVPEWVGLLMLLVLFAFMPILWPKLKQIILKVGKV